VVSELIGNSVAGSGCVCGGGKPGKRKEKVLKLKLRACQESAGEVLHRRGARDISLSNRLLVHHSPPQRLTPES
jgi:hypothetical protein